MLYRGFSNTILVVDEKLMARKTVCRNLEYYKYKVLEAADGIEALKLFRDHQSEIGLVLLDPQMAKIASEDVLAQLRAADPEVRIAVITEDATGLDQEGLVGVIRKPVRTDRLLAVVRKALEG